MDRSDDIDALIAAQEAEDDEALARKFGGWPDVPVLIIFAVLFGTVFLQFFTRYVLNDSLSWTEEASRYLLILLAFVGVIKCELMDSHIRLEFIDSLLKKHVRWLKQIATLLSIFFFSFLGYTLVVLAKQTSFQKMVSLPYPKYYFYAIVIVSIGVLVVLQVVLFIKRFRQADS